MPVICYAGWDGENYVKRSKQGKLKVKGHTCPLLQAFLFCVKFRRYSFVFHICSLWKKGQIMCLFSVSYAVLFLNALVLHGRY